MTLWTVDYAEDDRWQSFLDEEANPVSFPTWEEAAEYASQNCMYRTKIRPLTSGKVKE